MLKRAPLLKLLSSLPRKTLYNSPNRQRFDRHSAPGTSRLESCDVRILWVKSNSTVSCNQIRSISYAAPCGHQQCCRDLASGCHPDSGSSSSHAVIWNFEQARIRAEENFGKHRTILSLLRTSRCGPFSCDRSGKERSTGKSCSCPLRKSYGCHIELKAQSFVKLDSTSKARSVMLERKYVDPALQ